MEFSFRNLVENTDFQVEYRINDYITLRLEENETIIYVNDNRFRQCKYLLLNIDTNDKCSEDVDSIDGMEEYLDKSLEGDDINLFEIAPEEEFWGHCSNLQAWVENGYDTRILHRSLAFPLLKELVKINDLQAEKVFKEEIGIRYSEGNEKVRAFLFEQNYLSYLSEDELESLGFSSTLLFLFPLFNNSVLGLRYFFKSLSAVTVNTGEYDGHFLDVKFDNNHITFDLIHTEPFLYINSHRYVVLSYLNYFNSVIVYTFDPIKRFYFSVIFYAGSHLEFRFRENKTELQENIFNFIKSGWSLEYTTSDFSLYYEEFKFKGDFVLISISLTPDNQGYCCLGLQHNCETIWYETVEDAKLSFKLNKGKIIKASDLFDCSRCTYLYSMLDNGVEISKEYQVFACQENKESYIKKIENKKFLYNLKIHNKKVFSNFVNSFTSTANKANKFFPPERINLVRFDKYDIDGRLKVHQVLNKFLDDELNRCISYGCLRVRFDSRTWRSYYTTSFYNVLIKTLIKLPNGKLDYKFFYEEFNTKW